MWQDYVLSIGGIFFALALIPSIKGDEKPSQWTSFVTGIILTIFTFTELSLDLYFAAATSQITASLWFVLGYQERKRIVEST